MNNLAECLKGVRTVAIAGHVNPDGDCIGSCMGVYLYLRDNFPDIRADVYMEKPREVFYYIEDLDQVRTEYDGSVSYDLLILDLHRSDFDHLIGLRRQTGGLQVKCHISSHSFTPRMTDIPAAADTLRILAFSQYKYCAHGL